MGSTDSIPQNNPYKLNLINWQYKYQSEQHSTQYGNYNRLKNKMTGQQLIQYQLYLNDKDQYTQFMFMHHLRNTNSNLVTISNINEENIKQLCSVVYHLKVYIEDFPLRLCHIKDIPFPQNLYVLDRALKGFHILFQHVGHFHLTEDLICINEEGIVKVWLNQDLSKSTPHYSKYQLLESMTQRTKNIENSMVWQLITIVEQLTNRQTIPNRYSFIDFLDSERVSDLDFGKTIEMISQYAEQIEAQIPQFFESVIKVIREKKGIYQSLIQPNNCPRKSVRDNDQFNFSINRNNFRQSKVQRIQSVKNTSSKSYADSESHTFADNLIRFESSFPNQMNAFGKGSFLRESLINKALDIKNHNQRFTQKLSKRQSHSSLSSVKIQSLNMIDFSLSQRGNLQKSRNPFSNITQKPYQQQQNPPSVTPPTYFSHIIQPLQHVQLLKKATIFSFGQQQRPSLPKKSGQDNRINRQIQYVKSLQHSKVNSDLQRCYKPLGKNSYNINLNQGQDDIQKREQIIQQHSMPISPPSIDKSSIIRCDKAKQPIQQKINYFHSRPIKQIQSSRVQEQIKNKNQSTQTDAQWFFASKIIPNLKDHIQQVRMHHPYPLSMEKKINSDKNPFTNNGRKYDFLGEKNQSREVSQRNILPCEVQIIMEPELKGGQNEEIGLSPKFLSKKSINRFLAQNQLGLDPQIYIDLMCFQQEKLEKKKKEKKKQNKK